MPGDDRLDGAEQPALPAAGLEQGAHEKGGGGLAVGAGNADDGQAARRTAEEDVGDGGHGGARVGDGEFGDAELQRPLDDERDGAALDGLGREVVSVAAKAGHAEEERSRLRGAAVIRERADPDRGVRVGGTAHAWREDRDDLVQLHGVDAIQAGRADRAARSS